MWGGHAVWGMDSTGGGGCFLFETVWGMGSMGGGGGPFSFQWEWGKDSFFSNVTSSSDSNRSP